MYLDETRKNPTKNDLRTSLILLAKKEYGDSAAFFSSFLPCSRCSAAVRKVAPPLANAFEFPFAGELLLFPLDFAFFFGFSSSSCSKPSSSSDETTPDRREAPEEREEDDFTDLVSTSESEGTIKSSSSEGMERARPVLYKR